MTAMQHTTWRVLSQQPRTKADLSGNLAEGYMVTFLTGGGNTGTIFVPNTQYTAENVREQVQAQADLLDHIGSLTEQGQAT